jgi:hypothetical protein
MTGQRTGYNYFLRQWDHVIAMKTKSQKKYATVTISIDLNKQALSLWNRETWMVPIFTNYSFAFVRTGS